MCKSNYCELRKGAGVSSDIQAGVDGGYLGALDSHTIEKLNELSRKVIITVRNTKNERSS